MAQLEACLHGAQKVAGSSPVAPTTKCYSDLISDQVEMRKTESASQPDVKLFIKWAQMHFLFGGDEG